MAVPNVRTAGGGAAIWHAMATVALATALKYPFDDPAGAELQLAVRLADGESAD